MKAMAPAGAFSGPVRTACRAERASLQRLLEWLDHHCTQLDLDASCRHDLRLIAEEASANVIAHAYPPDAPGPLSLQLDLTCLEGRPAVELTLEDQGRPFNPLTLPVPDRAGPVADLPIGGLGVHLIRQLSDTQRYRHDRHRGNVLTIGKFVRPAKDE
jgi:anti-sigma regulatory factor (Ser/Thr protein kinase)